MSQTTQTPQTADFAGFEASDAELQAVIGPVPPGADSDGRSTSIDYMQPIPGSEQSDLGAFLAAPDQVVRTRNYGQSAPDDAHLLVGGSGVDFGPRIGFIDYFKIIGGGIASFIPEGVRDFDYSRIVSESARLSSVDNPEYDGIADYSAGNGKGWTLSLPTYDDVKAGLGKAYNALAATFGEGQNTRDVSGLEYKDIDSYPEDVGSGWRLSVPASGELVDFANAMYGRSLSASNAYRYAIEQGNYYRAGLAFGSDPIVQGMGLMVGTFGLTQPLSASGKFAPNGASFRQTGGGSYTGSADELYDAIRASETDVFSISTNTGFKPTNIQKVKDHVFYNDHLLDRFVEQGIPARVGRFDSTIEQAQAWNRLENGIHTDADITWLKHETAERWYELKYKSGYSEAHGRVDSRWSGYPWEAE